MLESLILDFGSWIYFVLRFVLVLDLVLVLDAVLEAVISLSITRTSKKTWMILAKPNR